jgi:hypothetical protein
MNDNLKSKGDRIIKNIITNLSSLDDGTNAQKIVLGLLSKAGRSKDEVIQILGREIGLALAAVLAKPLEKMTESKQLRVTIDLIPKSNSSGPSKKKRAPKKTL